MIFENCCDVVCDDTSHSAVYNTYRRYKTKSIFPVFKKHPWGSLNILANNETGTINTIPKGNVIRFVDATAAVGYIPVDFKTLGCNYMAFTAHKIGGVPGIGALLIRKQDCITPKSPMFTGGEQEHGYRAGTESVALAAAFAAALEYKTKRLAETAAYLVRMRDALIDDLLCIPDAHLNGKWERGDCTKRLPGNINISFDGIDGQALGLMLSEHDIMVSTGAACSSGENEPSRVLLNAGVPENLAKGTIRITMDERNTTYDCGIAAVEITECVKTLRRM